VTLSTAGNPASFKRALSADDSAKVSHDHVNLRSEAMPYCGDIADVERISHHVGMMYLGRLVELGPRAAVFDDPRHPYTKALMSAVPVADPRRRRIHDAPVSCRSCPPSCRWDIRLNHRDTTRSRPGISCLT